MHIHLNYIQKLNECSIFSGCMLAGHLICSITGFTPESGSSFISRVDLNPNLHPNPNANPNPNPTPNTNPNPQNNHFRTPKNPKSNSKTPKTNPNPNPNFDEP